MVWTKFVSLMGWWWVWPWLMLNFPSAGEIVLSLSLSFWGFGGGGGCNVLLLLNAQHIERWGIVVFRGTNIQACVVVVVVTEQGEWLNIVAAATAITINREQTFACEWIGSGRVDWNNPVGSPFVRCPVPDGSHQELSGTSNATRSLRLAESPRIAAFCSPGNRYHHKKKRCLMWKC